MSAQQTEQHLHLFLRSGMYKWMGGGAAPCWPAIPIRWTWDHASLPLSAKVLMTSHRRIFDVRFIYSWSSLVDFRAVYGSISSVSPSIPKELKQSHHSICTLDYFSHPSIWASSFILQMLCPLWTFFGHPWDSLVSCFRQTRNLLLISFPLGQLVSKCLVTQVVFSTAHLLTLTHGI